MPSLTSRPERHVVIDRRAGHYLCFPDVCLTGTGALLCVYNEFDRHVGTRRRLMLRRSEDGGKTWSAPRLLSAWESHCPRISRLPDGGGGWAYVIADDHGPTLYWSADDGQSWVSHTGEGLGHGLIDRILPLDEGGEVLFATGHLHRGSQPQPKIRQAPTEQMGYVSRNRGRRWEAFSLVASEKCLVLCEASVIRLPVKDSKASKDSKTAKASQPPRLLALLRENSFVGEPMYCALSEDGGATWGAPVPTPLIGHRPTLGHTRSGKLLVTYRCVGPDPGTKAWLGTLDELCSGFRVHGLHPDENNPKLLREGLLVANEAGPDSPVRYALRPITDPEFATASLQAEVLVREADLNGCGLHLGMWWKLYPDCLVPDCDLDNEGNQALPVEYEPGVFHTIRVDYEPGLCRLFVDGEPRGAYPVDRMAGDTRPILAGAIARKEQNACVALWRKLSLSIREPNLPGGPRAYDWAWDHASGETPDAWIDARVLELRNDRQASPADFGYSGWVELPGAKGKTSRKGGHFFCAYHHGGGDQPGYQPGLSAHVAGTWFSENDFPK